MALRLGLALLAGIVLGLERGRHAHPAGLRTTVLVCVAACLAMLQANAILLQTADTHNNLFRLDVMRLPLGILSGIGFLGAGAILRRGDVIRGVTTAATIWIVTVIGLCFGGGQLGLGAAGAGIGLVTLWLMRSAEDTRLVGHRARVAITTRPDGPGERELLALLESRGFAVQSRHFVRGAPEGTLLECSGWRRGGDPEWSCRLVGELSQVPGVTRVDWQDYS
jgi:putative Mg2+ transporter-C (MgtC) family protein